MRNYIKQSVSIACLGALSFLASCQSDSESSVKHDHGKITRFVNPISWISHEELPFEMYQKTASNVMSKHELPELLAWSKEWVDRIDNAVRSKYPDQLQNTPKPEVAIINDKAFNAHITSRPFCYNVDISLEGKTGSEEGFFFPNANSVDVGPLSMLEGLNCQTIDKAMISSFLAHFSTKNDLGCKISETAKGFNLSGCNDALSAPAGISKATKLVVFRAVPYVNLNLGLFTNLKSQDSIIAVIAHELGHYYRAHSGAMKGEYNYFYQRSEFANTSYKPEASRDRELNSLGGLLQNLGPVNSSIAAVRDKVDGIQVDPLNFFAAGQIIQAICSSKAQQQQSCPTECSTITDLKDYGKRGIALKDGIGYYPFGKPDKHYSLNAIRAIDGDMKSCLDKVTPGIEFTQKEFVNAYTPSFWNLYPDRIVLRYHQGLAKYPELLSFEKAGVQPLFDSFVQNKKQIVELATSSYKKAWEKGLGWYTAEQEADDFSAEVLDYLGADTKAAGKVYLAFMRSDENNPVDGSFGTKACTKLMENDLKDENGNSFFLPVGDLVDTHHSNCFRMYNVMREIDAHGYYSDGSDLIPNSVGTLEYVTKLVEDHLQKPTTPSHFRMSFIGDTDDDLGDVETGLLKDRNNILSCKYNRQNR